MKKNILLGIIAILAITVMIMAAVLINSHPKKPVGHGIVLEQHNEKKTSMYVGTSLPNIAIPGQTVIELPAAVTEADISLHNPNSNADYYDLEFTLKLKDSDESLFSTGLIPPGYMCSHVTLNRALNAGEYDAVLYVQPYLQDENHTPVNNAELNILLIVK